MNKVVTRIKRKLLTSHKNQNDRLVNFIICGTQKAGTTALDTYLRMHPEICMADEKEVHFFDDESFFNGNQPAYSLYHSHFSPEQPNQILGEATPIYMYWHDAPRRIWEYNPNMKILIVLRNPITRAYSHWNMERSRSTEHMDFSDAIKNEEHRCKKSLPLQHRIYSYLDRGFYSEQLRRLWRYFPKENILILKHEYLKNRPADCLNHVCDFLNVEHFESIEQVEVHSRPYTSHMSKDDNRYLRSYFKHEIGELERLLGWDCSDWLSE